MAIRRFAKKDGNHNLIRAGLRAAGVIVRDINEDDLPDLLCGHNGQTYLLEVKNGKRYPSERRLRDGQQRFFDEWKGGPLIKIETLADAFRALGIEVE